MALNCNIISTYKYPQYPHQHLKFGACSQNLSNMRAIGITKCEATQWTLGGGGHGISECQAACHAQARLICEQVRVL